MSLSIVVGGQYGSEGKGKLTAFLAHQGDVSLVVRCGSTNSGHTVWDGDKRYQLRMIPAAFGVEAADLAIAAGAVIDVEVLRREVVETHVSPKRLFLDPHAMILESSDRGAEREAALGERIGSTQTGVGQAVARRVLRGNNVRLVRDVPELSDMAIIGDVSEMVRARLHDGLGVVIEGTQGYGLSLYHTPLYPFATSRDTTSSAFLSEVGVGPREVDQVILAVRSYPIRVPGNSGPFNSREITWEEVTHRSSSPEQIMEYTTVTNRPRRIAEFDVTIVKRAVDVNSATAIALHGADYIDFNNRFVRDYESLTLRTREFIERVEEEARIPVSLVGVGPRTDEVIDRRESGRAKSKTSYERTVSTSDRPKGSRVYLR